MNLPRIRFSRPSFSPRFFLFVLFGLVILVLAVEGGYYFWIAKKQQSGVKHFREGALYYRQEAGKKPELGVIIGMIQKIDGRELTVASGNKASVKLIVSENVRIALSKVEKLETPEGIPPAFALKETSGVIKEGKFDDLNVGDYIQASQLREAVENKFETEAVKKMVLE